MPRPGPRPYECVRRAWHSDRHQPMRGTLIQEIFRVVNDSHSSLTKKNKEWQLKLPIVVLKAEEIMYSKANSEAEYADVKTLRDRVNDAIDTIIRREEGSETGEFLQPCIEAALILGCTPRRASRSQRNSNPRCYLSPNKQEPSPRVPESMTHVGGSSLLQPLPSVNPTSNPQFMSYHSNFPRSMTVTTNLLGRESCSGAAMDQHQPIHQGVPLSFEAPVRYVDNQNFPESANQSLNFGRVYPLYDVTPHEIIRPQFGSQTSQYLHSNAATLDTPRIQSNVEAPVKGVLKNLFPVDKPANALNRTNQVSLTSKPENPSETDCDLSLRLGIQPASGAGAGTSGRQSLEFGNIQYGKSQEYCFFPGKGANESLDSTRNWFVEGGEGLHLESSSSKKRKEPVRSSDEDVHYPQQRNFPPDLFLGKMKRPDK
ncbi:hypothetical protein MKW98_007359 [Papaver atlanticum]|uniref:Histone acetyltransferase n=1 Tax=Papaver atlanticum TaxID=357466 RepID=A0AAD4XAV5_9MAGN|nr:hypothetical protein MKW98_007359 [Papaver atlanticum]